MYRLNRNFARRNFSSQTRSSVSDSDVKIILKLLRLLLYLNYEIVFGLNFTGRQEMVDLGNQLGPEFTVEKIRTKIFNDRRKWREEKKLRLNDIGLHA